MFKEIIDIIDRNGINTQKGSDGWILANIINEAFDKIKKRVEQVNKAYDFQKCDDLETMFNIALNQYGIYNPRHVDGESKPQHFLIASDYILSIPYNKLTRTVIAYRNNKPLYESYTNEDGIFVKKDFQIIPYQNKTKIELNSKGRVDLTLYIDDNPLIYVGCDYLKQLIQAKLRNLKYTSTFKDAQEFVKTNNIPHVKHKQIIKLPKTYYDVCPNIFKPFLSPCETVTIQTDLNIDSYKYEKEWGLYTTILKQQDPYITFEEPKFEDGIVEIVKHENKF